MSRVLGAQGRQLGVALRQHDDGTMGGIASFVRVVITPTLINHHQTDLPLKVTTAYNTRGGVVTTLDPEPETLNPEPQTPKPETQKA